MPALSTHRRLKAVNLVVAASMLFTLPAGSFGCTPALTPPRARAAAPEEAQRPPAGPPLRVQEKPLELPLYVPPLGEGAAGGDDDEPSVPPPPPEPVRPHLPPAWLQVSAEPAQAQVGERVTVVVRVNAEGDLDEAALAARLPRGLDFDAADGPGAVYAPAERRLHWAVGRVPRGQATFRFHVRLADDAPDLAVLRLEVGAQGCDGAATGEAVIKRTFPPSDARIGPEGGELRSADGRVHLIFPPGAVDEPLRVSHQPRQVDRLQVNRAGMFLQFELTAVTDDGAASPVRAFKKPLTLRADLSGLVDWQAIPFYQSVFLACWDEARGEWAGVPARREGDLLVASLDHFTLIGTGNQNLMENGWVLAFNDANVSTFNGGLSYQYPIEVPEGRGGLTPDLSLSYNSRRVDGILSWIQSDWAGLGWTLDTMEIVRKTTPTYGAGGSPDWCNGWVAYENKFTLLYKGTGYKLVPERSENDYGRYHTEDEQFLYIERRNARAGNGAPNVTSEYWIVRLRDGTECRLGYNSDAEQVYHTNYYTTTNPSYAGNNSPHVAFRWRVDRIQDLRGNQVEFSYYETAETSNPCGPDRERSSYLSEIRYNKLSDGNWGSKISFSRAARDPADGGYMIGNSDCWYSSLFYQDYYLDKIKVENYDADAYRTVREYVLGYDLVQRSDTRYTRILRTINHYGTTGSGQGNPSLPTTTFGYTTYANKAACGSGSEWDRESFHYQRLTSIDNGYGGTITLAYQTPDSGCGRGAFNYRVSEKTVADGRGGGYRVAYAYTPLNSERCYEDNDDCICEYRAPGETGGALVGYKFVTETLKTYDGVTAVSVITHEFRLNSQATPRRDLGRELVQGKLDASGTKLQSTATTWMTATGTFAGTYFMYPQWVEERWRVGSGLPTSPQKRTYYEYATDRQGNGQYGNVTRIVEYDGANVYRDTYDRYYPNTSAWIVDKLAIRVVKNAAGQNVTKQQWIYDSLSNNYDVQPVRGLVVRTKQTRVVDPTGSNDTWLTTQTITYTQAYSMPVEVADGKGNVTRTNYDTNWKMYPSTVTAAYGTPIAQTTTYSYDFRLGKVSSVYGPNGTSTTTSYEYDYWGRLTKVIRPGDTTTNPTLRYEYGTYRANPYRPLIITATEVFTTAGGSLVTLPTFRSYDGLGRLIQESQGTTDRSEIRLTNTTYNAQGLQHYAYVPYTVTWSVGACGYVTPDTGKPKTQYAYDALGRVTTVTNPDGTTVRTFYDGVPGGTGQRRAVIDERSHQKTYRSDAFGRLVEVKEYTGYFATVNWGAAHYGIATYGYDLLDNLTTVTDAASNQTTITYDSMGRKIGMNDPDMGSWQYEYDDAGNLKWQRDANQNYICFCYDALNRLTGKHYRTDSNCSGVSPHVEYLYDSTTGGNKGIGYRTGMRDNPTTWSAYWKYDSRGRVISETQTIGGSAFWTQWTYNSRDQVVTQVYPGGNAKQAGETVATAYGKWGQPARLTGTGGYEYVSQARPDALGRIDFMSFGNGQQTDWVYYAPTQKGGRLYQLKTGTSGNPTASVYLEYDYDNTGNVASIKDYNNSSQVQTFTYDDLDRLISAVTNAAGADQYTTPRNYSYHNTGNIYSFEGVVYQYQDSAHKHAVTHLAGQQKYWYDANGNQTKRIVGTNTFDLTYDQENRLSQVKKNSVRVASFTYNGDGARIRSVITDTGTTTTCFVGNYYEWTTAGTSYYYLWGQRVAKRTAAGVTHIHGDHLGSGVKTTGVESTLERYYPYGAQRGTNAVATPYRFTGQYEQGTIGLYYYNARWYDPYLNQGVQPNLTLSDRRDRQSLGRFFFARNRASSLTASGRGGARARSPWCRWRSARSGALLWSTARGHDMTSCREGGDAQGDNAISPT